MSDNHLYERVLGRGFEKLPPMLRDFHRGAITMRGHGRVVVRCGDGALRRLLARAMGLPRPCEQAMVDLDVTIDGEREIWRRSFDGRPLRTTQWDAGGLLGERSGPGAFIFKLHADARGLRFEHRRTTLFGVPIPRAIAPRVDADAFVRGDGWDLRVTISIPLLGMIKTYTGHIVPQP